MVPLRRRAGVGRCGSSLAGWLSAPASMDSAGQSLTARLTAAGCRGMAAAEDLGLWLAIPVRRARCLRGWRSGGRWGRESSAGGAVPTGGSRVDGGAGSMLGCGDDDDLTDVDDVGSAILFAAASSGYRVASPSSSCAICERVSPGCTAPWPVPSERGPPPAAGPPPASAGNRRVHPTSSHVSGVCQPPAVRLHGGWLSSKISW